MVLAEAPSTSDGGAAPPRRGRLGLVVIGLVAAVAAGGWAFVMANVGQRPGIEQQTISFKVVDDATVQIKYAVGKSADDVVRCVVDAVDVDFAPVARRDITIPRGTARIERDETLRTSKRATAARVRDCRKV